MTGEVLNGLTSDPVHMGWMQGSPPPADKLLLASRADHMRFPMIRWSYSNMRQFVPTCRVGAGAGATPFARALRDDLAQTMFVPLGADEPISFKDSLTQAFTDGIMVLHRGEVVFERWFGVTTPETRHIAFSVTKSFVGTLAEMLVEEGRLDPAAPVTSYLPELGPSGFGDATVRQVMDMTTALDFSEDYADPNSGIGAYSAALALTPRPEGYAGPTDLATFLPTISKTGEHGRAFTYRTPNTEVLAWLIARVEDRHLAHVLSERLWQPLGMLGDADLVVDQAGMAFAGGGLNLRLEDLARFGEAMRLGGVRVIPTGVVDRVRMGGDPAHFDAARYPQLPGWSYGSQWWHSHNNRDCFSARGIHGQTLWVDPAAEMTVARFASHPTAANGANDPLSLPAWAALADALSR
ncbi:serine hydrolase [Novosphingobium sp. ERN07]|uniref:serine hydrolase domain-containing protein n=1 Tax=Novosphingobium sp. ERN07 TaxID=2726187 RepID=UPI0014573174|nr:serine hydrolase [Novosphingobium sp. ERN07]NLR72941.1 serine hydrolase [Novosphingobium sp. ERN07]